MPALSPPDPAPLSALPDDPFDPAAWAEPSARAQALMAPITDVAPDAVREARPGYTAPAAPFYASPDGRLRLYQADALDLLRRMRDESVDMVFADPPYFLSNGGVTCVGGRVDKGNWDKSQGITGDHTKIFPERITFCRRLGRFTRMKAIIAYTRLLPR